jgi:hypothetical protein
MVGDQSRMWTVHLSQTIDCRVTIAISGYTHNLFSDAIIGKLSTLPSSCNFSTK